MSFEFKSVSFTSAGTEPLSLERVLKLQLQGASWNGVRKLVSTAKVLVNGQTVTDARQMVPPGVVVEVRMTARRANAEQNGMPDGILYLDPHVVVVNKPAGLSSVEHASEPTNLQTETRRWLHQRERRLSAPLKVVHRLDKVTSGVMLFARNKAAQSDLKAQFRAHTTGRFYTAVAHGLARSGTLHYQLVRDRGDGYRGVTQNQRLGQRSITHLKIKEKLGRCCLVECRLETGRTHQIRIHMAEIGHPLVGDPLYMRDFTGSPITCARTLLHASFLAFTHPVFRKRLEFSAALPTDFEAFLKRERRQQSRSAEPREASR